MRQRARVAMATALALAGLAACGGGGGGGDSAPPATVPTTAPGTTIAQGDPVGIGCVNVSTQALQLINDYTLAAGGVDVPDPGPYRERAAVLRAEHIRLGCRGELLKGFLEG